MYDAGDSTEQIYNIETGESILLRKGGNTAGENNTEESIRILELTDELYEKYIEE